MLALSDQHVYRHRLHFYGPSALHVRCIIDFVRRFLRAPRWLHYRHSKAHSHCEHTSLSSPTPQLLDAIIGQHFNQILVPSG